MINKQIICKSGVYKFNFIYTYRYLYLLPIPIYIFYTSVRTTKHIRFGDVTSENCYSLFIENCCDCINYMDLWLKYFVTTPRTVSCSRIQIIKFSESGSIHIVIELVFMLLITEACITSMYLHNILYSNENSKEF